MLLFAFSNLLISSSLQRESNLTACVTRWWAGRDNAGLPETTSRHANCLKTRRVPPVGCTLCWAFFAAAAATGANNQFCNHTQTILLIASIFPLSTTTFFITMQQPGYLIHDMGRK